jgi:hypothetical protein
MTTFNTTEEALAFKKQYADLLKAIQEEVESVDGVDYSEVWLCGNAPSFVAGVDSNDLHIVSIKI